MSQSAAENEVIYAPSPPDYPPEQVRNAMFFKKDPNDAASISAGMSRIRIERNETNQPKSGVIQHPNGSVERFEQRTVQRSTMVEVQAPDFDSFLAGTKALMFVETKQATALPYKRDPDIADVQGFEADLRNVLARK